jgi:hypothetical protein
MEETELLTVRIEVNGNKELRVVERVEVGKWDLPKLIPRLYPGETLVETITGYKVVRIREKDEQETLRTRGCQGFLL